jgi:hypothetical protein
MQHNVSVMMAACDTFRSGAVEQLRTHANRLQVFFLGAVLSCSFRMNLSFRLFLPGCPEVLSEKKTEIGNICSNIMTYCI